MNPYEILSVEPADFTEPTADERFLRFAKATVDTLKPHPDLALDLSRRLANAGLEGLSRSFSVLSDRARYPSHSKENQ